MALSITWCSDDPSMKLPVVEIQAAISQGVTGSSQQSDTAPANTSCARLYAAEDTRIAIGTSPTATATDTFIPAGAVEYFKVTKGERIAVIAG